MMREAFCSGGKLRDEEEEEQIKKSINFKSTRRRAQNDGASSVPASQVFAEEEKKSELEFEVRVKIGCYFWGFCLCYSKY